MSYLETECLRHAILGGMPNWNETVEAHRVGVRRAIVDTAAALVAQHGPRSVTMSQLAEETGLGRATLYKDFPGVEASLVAWHDGHGVGHLRGLEALRDGLASSFEPLEAVLA